MSDFFEIDPVTGIKTVTDWDEMSQTMTLTRTADVEPVLDFTKGMANEVGVNKEDIKKGWWLYAKIPPIIELQMRAKGINISDRDHQARMIEEINKNYPYLRCTTGWERGRGTAYFGAGGGKGSQIL